MFSVFIFPRNSKIGGSRAASHEPRAVRKAVSFQRSVISGDRKLETVKKKYGGETSVSAHA